MNDDLIVSLKDAIESLTTEVRLMRGGVVPVGVAESTLVLAPSSEASQPKQVTWPNRPATDLPELGAAAGDLASLAEVKDESAKAQEELDRMVTELSETERKLSLAHGEIDAARGSVEKLEAQKADLSDEVKSLTCLKDNLTELHREISAAEIRLQAILEQERTGRERETRIAQREAQVETALEQTKHASELLNKLWPEWLCADLMKDWKAAIEQAVYSESAPPSFQLLFAAIHNYRASLRDPDNRIFLDGLRDLGRRLYLWLRDLGKDEETMAEIVQIWASAINAECEERGSVQVPVPGNPANIKWMNFTPKAGSSPDVATVRSWCVSDSQSRPIHRAEVVV